MDKPKPKPKPKPKATPTPTPADMGAIDRANRAQAREAEEMKRMKKKPTSNFAKGGSVSGRADGVAKKGKTHTKMVKMAMGGIAGRGMMRPEHRGGPARATFKKGGSCGKKGK